MESMPTISRDVVVRHQNGLHLGPSSRIVQTASRFKSQIEIRKGDKVVDGKSILDLLTLVAEQGAVLTLCARGDDAVSALEALALLFERDFQAEATA
jgi:phosphotransferase system HPr (HPr) family protein